MAHGKLDAIGTVASFGTTQQCFYEVHGKRLRLLISSTKRKTRLDGYRSTPTAPKHHQDEATPYFLPTLAVRRIQRVV